MTASGEGRSRARRGWLGLVLALLLGAWIGLLHLSANRLLESIEEGVTLSLRFHLRGPLAAPDDVAIIIVDDRSLAELGRWPWPRAILAKIIDRLAEAGAKTIGFDVLMSEYETVPESGLGEMGRGERALVESMERHGHVVLAAAMLFSDGPMTDSARQDASRISLPLVRKPAIGAAILPTADGILRPLPEFEKVAAIGHVNLPPDDAGIARAHYPAIQFKEWFIPSFPLMVAAEQLDVSLQSIFLDMDGTLSFGSDVYALDYDLGLTLNYLGPTGTFRTYSALDLLQGRIPDALLANRAVLVGANATSLADNLQTPFDSNLAGVEALATGVANLMHGGNLIRTNEQRAFEALLIVALTLLAWWISLKSPGPRWGLGINFLLLSSWLVMCQLMFVIAFRWVAVAGPGSAIIGGALLGAVGRMVQERRLRSEAERQRENLARYVPPALVDTLAERTRPAFDKREQMAAVLFVDLQGFTQASETRSPSDTAQFLKEFHDRLEEVVTAHKGVVAQFLGDGAFVLWGLPQPREDDPALALACARDMLIQLARWQPKNPARVGVHYGPVAMAQLGGRNQAQLAAAGDTVNVASRLEAAAKAVNAVLVISDDMVAAVRALGRADLIRGLKLQDAQPVRGRDKPISYWSAASCADLA